MATHYDQKDLELTIAQLQEGKDPDNFPPPLLFMAQYYLYQHHRFDLVNKIMETARRRLFEKGYVRCGSIGWFKKQDINRAGLVFKYNNWTIENVDKYLVYCSEKFNQTNENSEYQQELIK